MFASLARIAVLAAFAFGIWKFYPRLKPAIQPILANPKTLGAEILGPAIKTINEILPDKIQIPSPRQSDSEGGQVNGTATSSNPSSSNSPNNTNLTNTIINTIKEQAADLAQDQIDAAKKEAGKAFCQVLIEKVKTECNL